jgi:hypothetical protein
MRLHDVIRDNAQSSCPELDSHASHAHGHPSRVRNVCLLYYAGVVGQLALSSAVRVLLAKRVQSTVGSV